MFIKFLLSPLIHKFLTFHILSTRKNLHYHLLLECLMYAFQKLFLRQKYKKTTFFILFEKGKLQIDNIYFYAIIHRKKN